MSKHGSRKGKQASSAHVSSFLLGAVASGMLHRCSTMGWKNSVRPRADIPQMNMMLLHSPGCSASRPLHKEEAAQELLPSPW